MFKSAYKAVASAMNISTPIVDRSVDKRIAKQLLRKANLHMIDASTLGAASYIEQNPKLRKSFWDTMKELSRAIRFVRKQMR